MVEGVVQNDMLKWIALAPLIGAAIHGVNLTLVRGWSMPRIPVYVLSCGAVLVSFLLSLMGLMTLNGMDEGERVLVDHVSSWIAAGKFSAELSFQLDPISSVMTLVVTGVGFLIHVYSIGYMDDDHRDDKGFQRFFCYLNLFTFSMLVLVLGDNLLLLFLGWEGVGLCSYLLIGFWYSDRFNAYCGSKAFIVNRIGDFGFLIGIFLLFGALADLGYPTIVFRELSEVTVLLAERTVTLPGWLGFLPGAPEWKLTTLIGLCFFVGACGKSAQIPLYVWLPDAMAGPTPVSALIHAATMVTAGVYMVCRMSFLYSIAPGASATIAWVGALTAIMAATIAIAQTDIKKVLAYSTVSQLGYMFLAAGCGAYSSAIFHLGTHAFFKALLFLGSGAVILAMHHEQDTDKMGGLSHYIPWTRWTFLIGVATIAGLPLASGFFSKDEILLTAFTSHVPGHYWLYGIGIGTAVITSFYMYRVYYRTFRGECRVPIDKRSHIHEPAWSVRVPLVVLAVLSLFAGLFLNLPPFWGEMFLGDKETDLMARFLGPALFGQAEHHVDHATEWKLIGAAVSAFLIGWGGAFLFYIYRPELPVRIRNSVGALHRAVREKYYVDEIYDATLVRPLVAFSDKVLFRGVDAGLIDGAAVNGSAYTIRALAARGLKYAQTGLAQSYLFLMVAGTVVLVGYLLR